MGRQTSGCMSLLVVPSVPAACAGHRHHHTRHQCSVVTKQGRGDLPVPPQRGGKGAESGPICSHLFLAPVLPCPAAAQPRSRCFGLVIYLHVSIPGASPSSTQARAGEQDGWFSSGGGRGMPAPHGCAIPWLEGAMGLGSHLQVGRLKHAAP